MAEDSNQNSVKMTDRVDQPETATKESGKTWSPIQTRNSRLQLRRLQGQLRDEGISSSSANMVDNNDINMEEVTSCSIT